MPPPSSGTSSPVMARAVTRGGGMTFSGVGVILRPSVDRAAIKTETENGERRLQRGGQDEEMARCS